MLADDRKYLPFSHPDWLFEIKYDGWRMLAEFGAGAVALKTRAGNDCTTWFPEIVRALEPYEGGPYITAGEVAVLDHIGRSDFNRLQDRALRRGPGGEPVIYCMFDLLHAGRTSLLEVPLALRKALLLAETPSTSTQRPEVRRAWGAMTRCLRRRLLSTALQSARPKRPCGRIKQESEPSPAEPRAAWASASPWHIPRRTERRTQRRSRR
jgi:hypothetical protein